MNIQTWLKRALTTVLILGFLLSSAPTTLVQRLGGSAKGNVVYAIPFVTATKDDVIISGDGDLLADPGETIRYTSAITNSGTTNASSVLFSDTIDANTTLAPGSVKTTPIARNDGPYSVLGNVGITVPAGSGVLVNDNDPDGGSVSVSSFDATSVAGGNVSVAGDGSFTYNPPPGYEGSDSFEYRIQDGDGNLDPALVALLVTDVIWFVNNTAPAGGDGRLSTPFNSLSAYNSTAAGDPGDAIYLYTGSGSYSGGIALQANQLLIGQGAGASLQAITGITPPAFSNALPATGGAKPTLTNGGGTGVTLAANNLVRGLAVSGTSGSGIAGTGVGAVTIQEVNVSSASGNGIYLVNPSGTATLDNVSAVGSIGRNVLVEQNAGTATINVTNATINTAGSDGFALVGSSSANATLNVSGSSFTHNTAVQLKAHAEGSSTVDANITGNSFDGDPAAVGNVGIDLAVRDSASLTFDVLGTGGSPQVFQPFRGQVINVFASGGGTASGRVNGNTVLGSAFGAGVRAVAEVTDVGGLNPNLTLEVANNTISDIQGGGLAGIHVEARDGTNGLSGVAAINATVTNNTVTTNGADAAIQVYLSDLNGTNNRVCLNASGNATQANGGAFGETDFFFGNDAFSGSNSGIAQMQGYSGSVSNTWFNVNGNTSTTSPTPLADSLGPIGPGTCSVVAQSAPAQSAVLFARAAEPAPFAFNTLAAALRQIDAGVAWTAGLASALVSSLDTLATSLGTAPAYASGETVNLSLGDLNPGQVVEITFDVMVDHTIPPSATLVCNQASFSGANFVALLTDDPDVAGSADPTCTAVDIANAAPVADDDSYSTNEDTALNVAAPGVLDGDTDANNDALTAVLDSGPSNGMLTLNSDGSFIYAPNPGYCGTDSFTYHANDGQADSNVATVTLSIICVNYLPMIMTDYDTVTVNEGQTATNSGTVSDADGDTVALSASVGSVVNHNDGTWSWSYPTTDGPAQSGTVTIYGDDGNGGTAQASFDLKVDNVAPSIVAFLVPPEPINLLAQPIGVSATFTDPVILGDTPYTCAIDYGDGTGTQHGLVSGDECSGSHTYADPGVYALNVAVIDKDSATGSATYQYVVVYDPTGGFVTGGGWIDSPSGAYRADPDLTGKASFGFVSKYKKGQSVPDGSTEFQFKAADMNFRSSSYDWLIIAGPKATFKGAGTINGSGNYGFMLTAIDAAQTSSTDVDRFRIKIWDKDASDALVYDNQVACSDTADGADPCTTIGGGSIVIHTAKGK